MQTLKNLWHIIYLCASFLFQGTEREPFQTFVELEEQARCEAHLEKERQREMERIQELQAQGLPHQSVMEDSTQSCKPEIVGMSLPGPKIIDA